MHSSAILLVAPSFPCCPGRHGRRVLSQIEEDCKGASPEMSGSTTCPPVAGLVSPDGHCESLQVPAELCQTDSGSIKIQHFIETGVVDIQRSRLL
eukprot:symbB.v1.2.029884.t1/scaffold3315.1/size59195/3